MSSIAKIPPRGTTGDGVDSGKTRFMTISGTGETCMNK